MRPYTKIKFIVQDHRLKIKENKRNKEDKIPDKPVEVRIKK